MRNCAPVNSKVLKTVSILYPDMMGGFLGRVGTKCVTPAVTFMSLWNAMFTTGMKGRRPFKNVKGRVTPRYSTS